MFKKLTKATVVILLLTLLALVFMSIDFSGDTFYEMIGDAPHFYENILVFFWFYVISFAFICFFSFIARVFVSVSKLSNFICLIHKKTLTKVVVKLQFR